jgi:hypothetical protein
MLLLELCIKPHLSLSLYISLQYFAMDLQGVVTTNDISLSVSVLRLLDSILTRSIVVDPTGMYRRR